MNTTAITTFNNEEFGNVRTLTIDGEPWFVGKDIAECLGYSNTKDALRKHVDSEDKIMGSQNATPSITDNLGRKQFPTFINESGVYSLILSSKLESATCTYFCRQLFQKICLFRIPKHLGLEYRKFLHEIRLVLQHHSSAICVFFYRLIA